MFFVFLLESIGKSFELIRSGDESVFTFLPLFGLSVIVYFLHYQVQIDPSLSETSLFFSLFTTKSIIILIVAIWFVSAILISCLKELGIIEEEGFTHRVVNTGIFVFCGCVVVTGIPYSVLFHLDDGLNLLSLLLLMLVCIPLYSYLLIAWVYIVYGKQKLESLS